MAMLSVRINRFEKKARKKMKFNNRDAPRFDKKKVKCYKCSKLGHFARECTGKQLDSKARYSAFKLKSRISLKEPKALLSVDSMLNWSDHEGEDEEKGAAQVYGMIAGDDVVHTCPFGCEYKYAELKKDFDNLEVQYKIVYPQVKLEESKARFDKWKESSKNLDKLINNSMSSRSKFDLGFGETFRSDEVFDPSAPSIFDTTPEDVEGKPLYDKFVKAVRMHVVPSPITGTFMPPSNKPDLDDTQVTYGSKSNNYFETNYVSNDFVLSDNTTYVPAGSRNPPAYVSAGSAFLAGSRNRPASVSAGLAIYNTNVYPMDRGKMGELLLGLSRSKSDNPHKNKDLGIVDSGCSRSMTGNKEKLDDYLIQLFGGPHWDAQSLSARLEGRI
ncbi:putative ribonuclease H-like domain-containing protein [Tanacetum coccineum]